VELRHLKYLLAVAEHGRFTRAAEALHVSQPTLSQQVAQMERALQIQLLDRTGPTVQLTDAGVAYVQHARRVLQEMTLAKLALTDVENLSRGTLRLAMTPTFTLYLVGPVIGEFHNRHPGVTLKIIEMAQERIEPALLADTVDLGIAFGRPHLPGIDGTALYAENLSLVVGAGHPLAGRHTPMPLSELDGRRVGLLSPEFITRDHIDAYFAEHDVHPEVAVEVSSITALISIIEHTDLVTVLPDAIVHRQPGVRRIALDPSMDTRTVSLLRRESAYESFAARAFTALARRRAPTLVEHVAPTP
jgi:LysR family cyn operon transcriptional activator